jgi:hypothetical protein
LHDALAVATPLPRVDGAILPEPQGMTCRLESSDTEIATGILRIQPGTDDRGAVTRISSGSLQLSYRRATEGRGRRAADRARALPSNEAERSVYVPVSARESPRIRRLLEPLVFENPQWNV